MSDKNILRLAIVWAGANAIGLGILVSYLLFVVL